LNNFSKDPKGAERRKPQSEVKGYSNYAVQSLGQKDTDHCKPDYYVIRMNVTTVNRTDNPQVLIPAVSQRFSVKGFNLFGWPLICTRITEHY
jgi:hypothetical protein